MIPTLWSLCCDSPHLWVSLLITLFGPGAFLLAVAVAVQRRWLP